MFAFEYDIYGINIIKHRRVIYLLVWGQRRESLRWISCRGVFRVASSRSSCLFWIIWIFVRSIYVPTSYFCIRVLLSILDEFYRLFRISFSIFLQLRRIDTIIVKIFSCPPSIPYINGIFYSSSHPRRILLNLSILPI